MFKLAPLVLLACLCLAGCANLTNCILDNTTHTNSLPCSSRPGS